MKVEFMISEGEVTLIFKKVKGKKQLSEAEAKEASLFLKAYYKQIISKWQTVFIYHKKVKCEVINKKLDRKT